ncbi:V-set and transmembrane domain-containing protein 5 isoform X2 [Myxocyprinus asiaticus]|uniref:V-set and transmembrane domain-containing protein 5 isoform X2 n=1 Tax=Myxocyprinus asiaticus TaxID=70543 RepID=UPI002221F8EA|nr:V-set and transmembrane domain-containing protein 5 isoform X2 [Myxocyprinus asiaticus]XP_051535029.1 V-set and transmembrane domain-containing protein 5 isoform X2 [Myxocyprinus asiaticus]XP_051535030.1 V-set and transmembrane domain-containing protein 5 isoform X2 [Myxocyprinus asiaticus]
MRAESSFFLETLPNNLLLTQAITIQVQRNTVTAPVQGRVHFSVNITFIDIPTVTWMFNSVNEQQSIAVWMLGDSANVTQFYEGRVQTHPSGSLTISDLRLQDSGYYIITVTEPSGNSKDAGLVLNVTEVLYEDIQYLIVSVIGLGILAAFLMLCMWLLNKLSRYIMDWSEKRRMPEYDDTELQRL